MLLSVRDAVRPRATAAVAARSVATRTMRGLRSLMETQLPSGSASALPTQHGLSGAGCVPSTTVRLGEGTNGVRLVAGLSRPSTPPQCVWPGHPTRSAGAILVAPTPPPADTQAPPA